jgi:hypothetical protein
MLATKIVYLSDSAVEARTSAAAKTEGTEE